MNKLKIGAKALVSCIGLMMVVAMLAGIVEDQWNLPTGSDGRTLPPSEAPCIPYTVNDSTGTQELLIAGVNNAGNTVLIKTPGYVSWVQLSTGAVTVYLDLKDTDKTGSGQKYNMIPPLMYRGAALAAGAYDSAKISEPFVFRPPMIFQNGLAVKLSAAGVAATVCYRKLTQNYP